MKMPKPSDRRKACSAVHPEKERGEVDDPRSIGFMEGNAPLGSKDLRHSVPPESRAECAIKTGAKRWPINRLARGRVGASPYPQRAIFSEPFVYGASHRRSDPSTGLFADVWEERHKASRFTALVTACWLTAVQPVLRRTTIRPWRFTSFFKSSKSL